MARASAAAARTGQTGRREAAARARALSSGGGAALTNFFRYSSNSTESLPELFPRVAIARRRCVRRDRQDLPDPAEGQSVVEVEDHHLALLRGQLAERRVHPRDFVPRESVPGRQEREVGFRRRPGTAL